MGSLHPIEQLLTLLLAFGPFVILGGVIWWRRRTEAADHPDAHPDGQPEETVQPER
jgi:uncharacterized iron-regulated membrane protein